VSGIPPRWLGAGSPARASPPEDRVFRERVIDLSAKHDSNVSAVGRATGKAPIQIGRSCHRIADRVRPTGRQQHATKNPCRRSLLARLTARTLYLVGKRNHRARFLIDAPLRAGPMFHLTSRTSKVARTIGTPRTRRSLRIIQAISIVYFRRGVTDNDRNKFTGRCSEPTDTPSNRLQVFRSGPRFASTAQHNELQGGQHEARDPPAPLLSAPAGGHDAAASTIVSP
jgi:hypothetical protein